MKEKGRTNLPITIIVVTLLLVINNLVIFLLVEKNKTFELNKPEIIVDAERSKVTWSKVENADGYAVYIDNELYKKTENKSLFIKIDEYSKTHIIQVEAYSNNEKYKSALSKPVLYQVNDKVTAEVTPFITNDSGEIIGRSNIDIFNNAFFKINFDLSGHYKFRLKYTNSSRLIDEFKIKEVEEDLDVPYTKLDDNWVKVYIDADKEYSIELNNLNDKYEMVDIIWTTYYETSMFDEYDLLLNSRKPEVIKVKYEDAEDVILRTKRYDKGVYLRIYDSLREIGLISNGFVEHLALVSESKLEEFENKEFYLYVNYSINQDIDLQITIEKVNLDTLDINLDEEIIVEDLSKVRIYRFTNTGERTNFYIEYFDGNVSNKVFYNFDFYTTHSTQIVKTNSNSYLFNIEYVLPDEVIYMAIIPANNSSLNEDHFKVTRYKPLGW